jgi:hypothetical protein
LSGKELTPVFHCSVSVMHYNTTFIVMYNPMYMYYGVHNSSMARYPLLLLGAIQNVYGHSGKVLRPCAVVK